MVSENCRVYCTDIFRRYPVAKKINDSDIEIPDAEIGLDWIGLVAPDIFVCMGNFAKKPIKKPNGF